MSSAGGAEYSDSGAERGEGIANLGLRLGRSPFTPFWFVRPPPVSATGPAFEKPGTLRWPKSGYRAPSCVRSSSSQNERITQYGGCDHPASPEHTMMKLLVARNPRCTYGLTRNGRGPKRVWTCIHLPMTIARPWHPQLFSTCYRTGILSWARHAVHRRVVPVLIAGKITYTYVFVCQFVNLTLCWLCLSSRLKHISAQFRGNPFQTLSITGRFRPKPVEHGRTSVELGREYGCSGGESGRHSSSSPPNPKLAASGWRVVDFGSTWRNLAWNGPHHAKCLLHRE